MRAVVQRVKEAHVDVDQKTVGRISHGFLVLLGVQQGDTQKDGDWIAAKLCGLRIFEDEQEKMNLNIRQVGGSMLMVSQFTLCGDARHGNRPSFAAAARPEEAKALYQYTMERVRALGVPVEEGIFQADMQVSLVNDGPVTILLDSGKDF